VGVRDGVVVGIGGWEMEVREVMMGGDGSLNKKTAVGGVLHSRARK